MDRLLGVRDTADHQDEIYIGGLWSRTPATPPGAASRPWWFRVGC
jgi:hypothetical protein